MEPTQIRDLIRKAYDRHARERDLTDTEAWRDLLRKRFVDFLFREGKKTVLEIGAGPGHDSLYFKMRGLSVTAVDLSPEMVRLCREKGLDADVMDVVRPDFPDERFDAIWSVNCLVHVRKAELDRVLSELSRILKKDGIFGLGLWGGMEFEGIWDGDSYEPKRFFSFFSDSSMREAVSRHFECLSFETWAVSDGPLHFQYMVLRKRPSRHHGG
ncbi:class I SAM-dependent DNA methyltransferase [Staphylospora marina]|uniref:class I SAM-dependent DNA methyltransferase n=1 Tax=Staphylospora marina TaxID=2490858 RepID=UPI0013DE1DEC|nr:class I SAM-dependent methyltransferase [Staphylospora marina]